MVCGCLFFADFLIFLLDWHNWTGTIRFTAEFPIKNEQGFDAQERIYGLVIWHNRVILREAKEKTLRDGFFLNDVGVKCFCPPLIPNCSALRAPAILKNNIVKRWKRRKDK